MTYEYRTSGVCARTIRFDVDENDIVTNVRFNGGCSGNTQGLSALIEGMKKDDVIAKLSGIRCGFKPTSCPDQLAKALSEIDG